MSVRTCKRGHAYDDIQCMVCKREINLVRHKDARTAWHKDRISAIQQIKLDSGCVDCGYNKHAEALDFDHILPGKTAKISLVAISRTWDKVLEEIALCEVVCANCHRVRTASRRGES